MPLCEVCRSSGNVQPPTPLITTTYPPHGMKWGEACDGCDREASVTVK